jgi:TctA family transporter
MKRAGYTRAALVLGFILGRYFEDYFWLSFQSSGPLFFVKPVSLGIIAVIIGLYTFGPVLSFIKRRYGRSPIETASAGEL